MQPYSDDYMTFDELRGRYVLTEKALVDNDTDMRKRLTRNRATNAAAIIDRVLRRASDMIYNYIHQFNHDNKRQDMLISTLPPLRIIIQQAMLEQVEYLLMVGDLSRSPDAAKRAVAIDYNARETLDTVVPELNVPITYAGGF